MIRVYLDWNAVSNLGKEENKELLDYLLSVQNEVLFPCSHAHIFDLLKGGRDSNPDYKKDLERLKALSKNHFFYIDNNQVSIHIDEIDKLAESIYNAKIENAEFDFNIITEILDNYSREFGIVGLGTQLKEQLQNQKLDIPIDEDGKKIINHMMPGLFDSENIWEMLKKLGPLMISMLGDASGYKSLTKELRETGYNVSHMIGDWKEEDVISNLDQFMSGYKSDLTFNKIVNMGMKKENGGYNLYEHFQTSYLQLGFIGYRQDKMKNKKDNWWNILADIEHSFLGGLCDVIVSSDSRMVDKSKVLYGHYNCPVDIVQLSELKAYLESKLHVYSQLSPNNFVSYLEQMIGQGVLVEEHDPHEELGALIKAYKLSITIFNYFTHLIKSIYAEEKGTIYTLRRVNSNFNKHTFFTETEQMVRRIEQVFGAKFKNEEVDRFVYGDELNYLDITFNNAIVRLETEVDFGFRPALSLIIKDEDDKHSKEQIDPNTI